MKKLAATLAALLLLHGPASAAYVGNGPFTVNPGTIATWGLAAVAAGTAPTNAMVAGAIYNSTEISPSTGQSFALQADSKGRLRSVLMDAAGNSRGANVNSSNQLSISIDGSTAALAVNATLSAETTKVIGTVNQGTSPWVDNATLSAETTKVIGTTRNLGNAGGIFDGATGAAVPANVLYQGCEAINAEITALTNGQSAGCVADLVGKQINMPFANKENFTSAGGSAVTAATNTSLIAAAGSGIKIYLTGFSCSNTGASTSLITFTSGSGGTILWTTINPAGSGSNQQIVPPVATAANAALFFTTATASTSQYCSVTGYKGS